jgi:hypothetical protein
MSLPVWDGLVRRKRIISLPSGEIDVGGVQNIREFINHWSHGAWKVAIQGILEAKTLLPQFPPRQSLRDLVVNRMWGIVNKLVVYKADAYYVDYWNEASETYFDKWGDCEDSSILLTSALRSQGIPAELAIGFYINPVTRAYFGHAFVLYPVEMFKGKMAVLESTWDNYATPNSWILQEGSHYHVTISGDQNGFAVKCACPNCQAMLNYLSAGAPITRLHKTDEFKILTQLYNIQVEAPKPSFFARFKFQPF